MPHGASGVVGSCKYSFSDSLEADVCIICVHLWLYIVGVCMCVLLVLVTWCPVYSSTLVYDLTVSWYLLFLIYPSCRWHCCLEVVYSCLMCLNTYCLSFSLHLSSLVMYPPPLAQRQHCFTQVKQCNQQHTNVSPGLPVLLLLIPSLRTRVTSTLLLLCY